MALRSRLTRVQAPSALCSALASRPLATTSVSAFPRGRPGTRTLSASATEPPVTVKTAAAGATLAPLSESAKSEDLIKDPHPEGGPSEPSEPPTPAFPAVVTSLTVPPPPTEELALEHHTLFNHLATSFIPSNQPCTSGSSDSHIIIPEGSQSPRKRSDLAHAEPVVALVCPFEGGDAYISQAVHDVAGHLSADVVRLDLALGVGFDGPHAPLSETGITAPPIPQPSNPVFWLPSPPPPSEPPVQEEDGGDEEESTTGMGIVRIPFPMVAGGPSSVIRVSRPKDHIFDEEWVAFFSGIINMQLPDGTAAEGSAKPKPAARRIVLLESTAAMAETLDIWYPSLLEAVRRRRRGPSATRPKARASAPKLTQPTTIVLSVPPSLLLSHTADVRPPPTEGAEGNEGADSFKDRLRTVAEVLGAAPETPDKHEEQLWWSSEEHDRDGRARRDERRLRALLDHGPESLLPFASSAPPPPMQPTSLLAMLSKKHQKPEEPAFDTSSIWRTLAVVPVKRDVAVEQHERTIRRRAVNAALMMRAVGQLGATLEEPTVMLEEPGSSPARGRKRRLARLTEPDPEWSELVMEWPDALALASTAVGRAATSAEGAGPIVLRWEDIVTARAMEAHNVQVLENTVESYLVAAAASRPSSETKQQEQASPPPIVDPVVEAIKKDKNLGKHEKRLLSCIVDPSKLATASFDKVHLPFKTIDAIRSVIQLPLMFPEAFQGGILKEHTTTGALLFGPPGTGKTLLARAIASESGVRMLAIQPSDVNDMWVGEGEKLVKAAFNLARKLSPCVMFIDEVDSLFGARSARASSGASKAHNQILTEFMQEMDGLSSADANREKRVMVLGATNRPFDLDDAVLRRLPRRLLVDLPTLEDRKAILRILLRTETIADDVSIDDLAAKTDGFSGSDLKNLCVSAALAAVKDTIDVPWNTDLKNTSTPPPASAAQPSRPSGGLREEVRLGVEAEGTEAEPQAPTPTPVAELTPNLSPAGRVVEAAYIQQLEARAAKEADARAEEQRGIGKSSGEGPDGIVAEVAGDLSSEAEAASESSAQESPKPKYQRTLTTKHFKTALDEIRPSSSEEGTLPELRKWAELFGEGGKKKGKKSGFGKGFGFGDDAKKSSKDFGRVDDGSA